MESAWHKGLERTCGPDVCGSSMTGPNQWCFVQESDKMREGLARTAPLHKYFCSPLPKLISN